MRMNKIEFPLHIVIITPGVFPGETYKNADGERYEYDSLETAECVGRAIQVLCSEKKIHINDKRCYLVKKF